MWDIESDRFSLTDEKSSLAAKPAMAACVKPVFILFTEPARDLMKEKRKIKVHNVLG